MWRAVLVAALVVVTGCAGYVHPRSGVVYVQRRPPIDYVEIVVAPPGPGHIWVRGYWSWRTGNFE
jgi:hypothetical protein